MQNGFMQGKLILFYLIMHLFRQFTNYSIKNCNTLKLHFPLKLMSVFLKRSVTKIWNTENKTSSRKLQLPPKSTDKKVRLVLDLTC